MSTCYYKLTSDFSVIPTDDLAEFALGNNSLFVDIIGEMSISTVFLGIDHGWGEGQEPVLFETMVFASPFCGSCFEGHQQRYTTYEEAKAGHEKLVKMVRSRMRP